MIEITYEVLYKDGNAFATHCSGKPDIRTEVYRSETALHHSCTSPHLYHYKVLKVRELSAEEYEKYMRGQRIQYEAIQRNHRMGVE